MIRSISTIQPVTNLTAPTDALAAVKIKVNIQAPGPVVDTLFDGTVTLTPGETFTKQAYNNATEVVYNQPDNPLGALDKVATLQGFTYNVTDKRWQYDQVLLLDDVSHYLRRNPQDTGMRMSTEFTRMVMATMPMA